MFDSLLNADCVNEYEGSDVYVQWPIHYEQIATYNRVHCQGWLMQILVNREHA